MLRSSTSYGERGGISADHIQAFAILYRPLHFSTTINIRRLRCQPGYQRGAGGLTELDELNKEA